MDDEIADWMLGTEEVPAAGQGVIEEMLVLNPVGFGPKQIAKRMKLSRMTVRRYLEGAAAVWQDRPGARALGADAQRVARI